MASGVQTRGNDTSDYEKIGGGPAVSQVVHRFYELVLSDPQLTGYFAGVDMSRLKRHQVLFVSQVLGGPADYDGRDLQQAHAGMQISHEEFGRVAEHLATALDEAGVESAIIARVSDQLAGVEPAVVSATP